ncbi:GntR family transcriptional regulator (plasmid) [Arthrobacter sp. StoSoilB3]|nr:GntR family transcriptional regulator [Arthrobacter sp. StoSoilB3]
MSSSSVFPQLGSATSRVDLIAESLRTAILRQDLKPGDVLVERNLAEQLGVSKTPVREALIMLARSGLVTSVRGRGTVVRQLSFTEVRHVYEERLLLEPWALRSSMDTGAFDFTDAAAALREAAFYSAKKDLAATALANRAFHRALYSGCENKLIVTTLDGLQDMVALSAITVFWNEWSSEGAESGEHERILNAARSGDGQQAEDLLRSHILTSIERAKAAEQSSLEAAAQAL